MPEGPAALQGCLDHFLSDTLEDVVRADIILILIVVISKILTNIITVEIHYRTIGCVNRDSISQFDWFMDLKGILKKNHSLL